MPAEALQEGTPQIPGKIRFQDFAPDMDPIIPGVLLEMHNLYPSQKGWRTYPGLTRFTTNMLPSACRGIFGTTLGGNLIVLAGTESAIWYLNNSVTFQNSGLSPTTMPANGRWRFDLYANQIIAVNGIDAPYTYDGSTFNILGGSPPVASIVQATDRSLFLIEANSSDWISTLNSTLWTPSIATQTVTGTLRKGAGNITAAVRIRGGITLFKRKATVFGQFSGPPFYWDFGNGVSDEVGVSGQEAVANLGDSLYWPGPDDFYSFDGYSLKRVPNNLKEWFFDNLNQSLDYLICARWDQRRSLLFWHFPSVRADPATALDSWICLNLRTGKWSADTNAPEIDVPLFSTIESGQLTYDALTTTYPTYGDMDFFYGDLQSRTTETSGAIRTSDHALHVYSGLPGEWSLTTHDFGDRENLYEVTQIRPQFEKYPAEGATIQAFNQRIPGTTPVEGPARDISADGSFDLMNTARLQRYKLDGYSEAEITGLNVLCEYAGDT